MINEYLLTFDTDWASDSIISEVGKYLIKNKIKSTWFITNDSPEIRKMIDLPDFFEVGIHPNFYEGSTQGKTPQEVMKNLLKIVPHAKSIRTHDLIQSTSLLKMIREEFNILYDVSLLLPETPNIIPHEIFYSKNNGLLRFPFFWEDDIEMYKDKPVFSLINNKYHKDGIKIFNFHPIHITLNSYSMKNYNICKLKKDINKYSLSELKDYINKSKNGTGIFFKQLIQMIRKKPYFPSITISELAVKWMNSDKS